jgi:hypothetical protein
MIASNKSLIKMTAVLIFLIVFTAYLYISPKPVKESHQLSEFLNIRTFTEVSASCTGTMTYSCHYADHTSQQICEDDQCCVWSAPTSHCNSRLCSALTDGNCPTCAGCSVVSTTSTSTTTTTTTIPINYIIVNGTTFTQPTAINVTGWSDALATTTKMWRNATSKLSGQFLMQSGTGKIYNVSLSSTWTAGYWNVSVNSTNNATLEWGTFLVLSMPRWWNNGTNTTNIAGQLVNFYVNWTSSSPATLTNFTFEYDNGTNVMSNGTLTNFPSSTSMQWSNVTKVINWTAGSTLRWMVYANDSFGGKNKTDLYSFTTHGYNYIVINGTTFEGNVVNITCWSENLVGNHKIYSNYSGTFANITLDVSGINTNFTNVANLAVGGYLVSCNSTINKTLENNTFTVSSLTPPNWWNNGTNSTGIAGNPVLFYVNWTATSPLVMMNYTFEYDNGTNVLMNDSLVNFNPQSASAWSNVTKVINWTSGSTIRWRVYANDSFGGKNKTDLYSFTTHGINYIAVNGTTFTQNDIINITCWSENLAGTHKIYANYSGSFANITPDVSGINTNFTQTSNLSPNYYLVSCNSTINSTLENITFLVLPPGKLVVNLITPPPGATTNQDQNTTFNVNASVTCRDDNCGTVYGTVRYNASSANPDTAVNITIGDKPFYITSNKFRPFEYVAYGSTYVSPERAYDDGYNDTSTKSDTVLTSGSGVWINYSYQMGSEVSGTIFVTAKNPGGIFTPGTVAIYNYTSNGWYDWWVPQSTSATTNATYISISNGLISSNGIINMSVVDDVNNEGLSVYDTYIGINGDILACGNLNKDQSCQLNWTVNATGNYVNAWKIGVLFNSSDSGVVNNHTDNATVKIIECTHSRTLSWSSIDFSNLNPNTAGSSNPAPGNSNKLYNISNTGTCTLQVWINGSDLINTTYNTQINVGNITWNNRTNDYTTSYLLNKTYVLINSSLTPTIKNLTTYYWLAVPPITAGKYNGNLIICTNTTKQSGQNEVC